LIDAFAQLERENTTLVIVGGGPQQEALRSQIDTLSLGNRVAMVGNQSDVIPWLQSFDAFVLPSYANEGVPQAILQAMACALPIVTTRAGAIPEVVVEGETALIVPTQDSTSLAAALTRLLDDSALRARFGAAARAIAVERFGIDKMLDKMEALFLETAAHG
jgi:glycosyltransferase involved in cell wall biosynthesis